MANEFVHATVGTSLTQLEFEAVGLHVLNSQATGDLIYASSGTQLSRLAIGAADTILVCDGSNPSWSATPTLNTAVAKGTWTASGTWTIPAVTLGGTVSAAGAITLQPGGDIDDYFTFDTSSNLTIFSTIGSVMWLNRNNAQDVALWSGSAGTGQYLYLRATDADVGNTLRDAPNIVLRGQHWTGVNTARDFQISHDLTTAGANPVSHADFAIDGVDILTLTNSDGTVSSVFAGDLTCNGVIKMYPEKYISLNSGISYPMILNEYADDNARSLLICLNTGGANYVPVAVFAEQNALNVNLGFFNGITETTVAIVNTARTTYTKIDNAGITATGSVDSAAVADQVSYGGYEISVGHRALAISSEEVVVAEVDETKFSHKLPVRINGATYNLMLCAT